jgi:UDP-N-acetylmuramate dehydrogenase
MQVQENFSLKQYNTFGMDILARYFSRFGSVEALMELSAHSGFNTALVLGGGSNILFTGNFNSLILKNEIRGIYKIREDDDFIYIAAGAGENWHQFVLHCIENGWAGIENLSLIPGCTGASPMQNIGAYGVEIKDVFYELKAFHITEKTIHTFSNENCKFGYRESVFKRKYKGQFIITEVVFRLRKKPVFNTSYGAIEQELSKMGVKDVSLKAVSDAVIRIRSSKLPDPAVIGNAGSFFKNPSVPKEQFVVLKQRFENITGYENNDGTVKLAAGWLIEHSGPEDGISWRGYRTGDVGVHAKQALVLVNYGNAKGSDIFELSERILQTVVDKFGVLLEREVNII